MKNDSIIAPIYMPAELRPEEFAPYFSALAAWVGRDAKSLESIFQEYRADTMSEDSAPARMKFFSFLFFECKAGADLLKALRKGRQVSLPLAAGHQQISPMTAN